MSSGVGGQSVRQENVSGEKFLGGTHFPGKSCPTGQDMLSAPGPSVPL